MVSYARGARPDSQPPSEDLVASDEKEFVLVRGAAHDAWCWEELTPRLVSRGHRVVTLDLPGHGRRAAEASRANVAAYAHAVANAMAREGVSILDRI